MVESSLIGASVFFSALVVVGLGWRQCRRGKFYQDTPWLWPAGIYIWGDALVLAPFWLLSALFFWYLSPLNSLRYYLLFLAIRAVYEVIYWINHQFSAKTYQAPLFRRVDWINSQESAILYQLINMCVVILAVAGVVVSYTGWR